MVRISIACAIINALLLFTAAPEGALAAARCEHRADVVQILPDLALPPIAAAPRGRIRLSEGRSCTESCMGQCRDAQRGCSGDAASCRANFQICARRCVVTCGSR